MKNIGLIGTVGVPACYGGFETLAENLVRYCSEHNLPHNITIYCSSKAYPDKPKSFEGARLKYIPFSANGVQSVIYDVLSIIDSCRKGADVILLLGVSGAVALPIVRLVSGVRVITNVDGIEWRRGKWRWPARVALRYFEKLAVRWSHDVISDNEAIADYLYENYRKSSHVIAYGGDHALQTNSTREFLPGLPENYAFALCRIEPENNVSVILDAFSRQPDQSLVFVGNWDASEYGKSLKKSYSGHENIYLLDAIYDISCLADLRKNAWLYVHGHSAGGTNPSLVEMMHFGIPVIAFDCEFNRYTTEGAALFFTCADILCQKLEALRSMNIDALGLEMRNIAERRYTWEAIGREYFLLLSK